VSSIQTLGARLDGSPPLARTQVYLTEEQDRRLTQIARERRISKAGALRWALDSSLDTGDAAAEERAVMLATAGICADYPDWQEWQREVRGRTAAERLDDLP
jgi:hypothetical protein